MFQLQREQLCVQKCLLPLRGPEAVLMRPSWLPSRAVTEERDKAERRHAERSQREKRAKMGVVVGVVGVAGGKGHSIAGLMSEGADKPMSKSLVILCPLQRRATMNH